MLKTQSTRRCADDIPKLRRQSRAFDRGSVKCRAANDVHRIVSVDVLDGKDPVRSTFGGRHIDRAEPAELLSRETSSDALR